MLELFSPAKINLFLRIVSKRTDGYHNLSSVFQTLSQGDTLTIERHDRDLLTCTDPELPTDGANLVLKATELFREKTGLKHFFKIHLIKRIPTQAGLGGGSSNAATVLWGCDQLAQTKIALATLKHWGAEIGSDVPFFLFPRDSLLYRKGRNRLPSPCFGFPLLMDCQTHLRSIDAGSLSPIKFFIHTLGKSCPARSG